MLGLFGALNLGTRSLQAQQRGVETAGQNLANVNNPAYARQRLVLTTGSPLQTDAGSIGTGVDAVTVSQVRNRLLDQQVTSESSLTALLQAQQEALQNAQADLGEQLDGASGSSSADAVGTTGGLADGLASLFNKFQALSTSPASLSSRNDVLTQAQQLASRLSLADQRLDNLNQQLNESVQSDVSSANQLLSDIAGLNRQIVTSEAGGNTANDLRDLRQQKLEALAGLVSFQSADAQDGVSVSVGGQLLVDGSAVQDSLQAYDSGGGQMLVRTAAAGTPLTLSGGKLAGNIEARDGALKSLNEGLNTLASQLITQVNAIHSTGYGLSGVTGTTFFTGTDAGDIAVNASLMNDPSLLQASGVAGLSGNNEVALALAQLGGSQLPGLGNQTFSQNYTTLAAGLGSALSSVTSQLSDQQVVQSALQTQRSAISGVSLDEEMTDLVKYQKAYQASAHLVSTINEMLDELLRM